MRVALRDVQDPMAIVDELDHLVHLEREENLDSQEEQDHRDVVGKQADQDHLESMVSVE